MCAHTALLCFLKPEWNTAGWTRSGEMSKVTSKARCHLRGRGRGSSYVVVHCICHGLTWQTMLTWRAAISMCNMSKLGCWTSLGPQSSHDCPSGAWRDTVNIAFCSLNISFLFTLPLWVRGGPAKIFRAVVLASTFAVHECKSMPCMCQVTWLYPTPTSYLLHVNMISDFNTIRIISSRCTLINNYILKTQSSLKLND